MATAITLKKGDMQKEAYVGFSWTTFFFGFLVPLFRGDIKGACYVSLIQFIVNFSIISNLGSFGYNYNIAFLTSGIGSIIVNIFVANSYNKYYTEGLLNNGYVPASENDKEILEMYI